MQSTLPNTPNGLPPQALKDSFSLLCKLDDRTKRLYDRLDEVLSRAEIIGEQPDLRVGLLETLADRLNVAVKTLDHSVQLTEAVLSIYREPDGAGESASRTNGIAATGITEPPRKLIGSILVEKGVLSRLQLSCALAEQDDRPARHLGDILLAKGFVDEKDVVEAMAIQLGVPFADLETISLDPRAVAVVPERLARRHLCVTVEVTDKTLALAMANPYDLLAIDDVARATRRDVKPLAAVRSELIKAIQTLYPRLSALNAAIQ